MSIDSFILRRALSAASLLKTVNDVDMIVESIDFATLSDAK